MAEATGLPMVHNEYCLLLFLTISQKLSTAKPLSFVHPSIFLQQELLIALLSCPVRIAKLVLLAELFIAIACSH